jgi:antitoxin ParD1/3/4
VPPWDKYVVRRTESETLIHHIECERPFDFDYWVDFLKLVTVKLPEKLINDVDQLVRAGIYHSRSDAIRAAVRDLLRRELWHTSQG